MTRLPLRSGLAAIVLLLGACAAPGSEPLTPHESAAPAPAVTQSPQLAPCQTGVVRLTEADNTHRICVVPGSRLEIYLQGTLEARWSDPVSDSPAVRAVVSGKRTLVVGVTGGFFEATAKGEARITAQRDCQSTTARCAAPTTFEITVTVA